MIMDPCLTTLTNIDSKRMKDLGIRPETIELLEENPEEKFSDANLSNDYSDMTTEAPAAEAKTDEWATSN